MQHAGAIYDVAFNDVPRFDFTEEIVSYLIGDTSDRERWLEALKKPPHMKQASFPRPEKREPSHLQLIDARIKELGDWRGETLARVRALIKQADPEVIEEVKWKKPSNAMFGVPVWEHAGIICTGETYKAVVKLTFAKGAALEDPSGLFNFSLEGNVRRAIDIHEGDKIDAKALEALIRAAVALNTSERAVARPVCAGKRPKSD